MPRRCSCRRRSGSQAFTLLALGWLVSLAHAQPSENATFLWHDCIYSREFSDRVKHMDIEQVLIAPRAPWQNPEQLVPENGGEIQKRQTAPDRTGDRTSGIRQDLQDYCVSPYERKTCRCLESNPGRGAFNDCSGHDLQNSESPAGAESGAAGQFASPLAQDLAIVVAAWPSLSDRIKVDILAMVKTGTG